MSSSLRIRFAIDIGGQSIPFANTFVLPSLEIEEAPFSFTRLIAPSTTSLLWDGTIPFTTLDFMVITSDVSCNIEIVIGSNVQRFTLPILAGGWPTIVPGGTCYAGQTGSQDSFTIGTLQEITKINCNNPDTATSANVSVLIAKVA